MTDAARAALMSAFTDLVSRTLGIAGVTGRFSLVYDLKCGGLVNIEYIEQPRKEIPKPEKR